LPYGLENSSTGMGAGGFSADPAADLVARGRLKETRQA
jgi:hypothetical protein